MLRKTFVLFLILSTFLVACTQEGEAPTETPPQAVIAAEQALSEDLGVSVDEIDIVSYRPEEWPDACLGLAEEGEMCAQVITPGWRVVLSAGGEEYVFRTDENGEAVRRES